MNAESATPLEKLTSEELVAIVHASRDGERRAALDELYRRYYPRVLTWCARVCGSRERAADVTQEVFVRVQSRIDTFRGASRFSTWLYTVARRVAINRMQAENLRRMTSLDDAESAVSQVAGPGPTPEDETISREIASRLRQAIEADLDRTEARVLYLHYVDGLTLPAITELLGLTNKSGAKAYIVGGKRKLRKKFGRWLAAQDSRRWQHGQ